MYKFIKLRSFLKNIEKLKNTDIKVQGFIQSRRIQKNICFIIIRQQHITIQCTTRDEEIIKKISNLNDESIIDIEGTFIERNNLYVNLNSELGKYEISVHNINIINSLENILDVRGASEYTDDNMNQYRYIAMRSQSIFNKIIHMSKVIQNMRYFFENEGFVEISLPILCRLSESGANSFYVYSKHYKDHVFGLAQSPQIFKQLLMIGDFPDYFSFSKCFRDESSRSDRLKEFLQCDVEIGIIESKEDVINIGQRLVSKLFNIFCPTKELQIETWTYEKAMSEYGSDYVNLTVIKIFNLKVDGDNIVIHNINDIYNTIKKQNKNIYYLDSSKSHVYFNKKEIQIFKILNYEAYKLDNSNKISCVWIIDTPMYEYDENGEKVFKHNQFGKSKYTNNNEVISDQYDLVIHGFEVLGGSVRENNYKNLIENAKVAGCSSQSVNDEFGCIIQGYKLCGSMLHGGFAIGVERFCLILEMSNDKNISCGIREYVAFPQRQDGSSLMLNMPHKK